MSSVFGFIDIRGTLLFHKEGEVLNPELAKCLKELNSHYQVDFHLFSYDSYSSFRGHQHMGVPRFWENYGQIAGLSNEAILRNGIFDISKSFDILNEKGNSVFVENLKDTYEFSKEKPESYRIVMDYYKAEKETTFLLDDAQNNLDGAIRAGIRAFSSDKKSENYIMQVTQFVMDHASPR